MSTYKVEICGVNTAQLPILKEEEKEELFKKIKAGDKASRETYIKGNLRLVLSVIKRFNNHNENVDDLFQIGCIGLMKAIDNFDTSVGVKFSTYAVPLITGEIKRFLRDDGLLKVSRTIKEDGLKVRLARQRLQSCLHREPTLQELSKEAELSQEEIILAMEAGAEVESLYSSVGQEDGSELCLADRVVAAAHGCVGASMGSSSAVENDVEKDRLLDQMLLAQLLGELPERDRELIRMRYFQNKTQTEIAGILGISQVQVSRLEKKILREMREMAG